MHNTTNNMGCDVYVYILKNIIIKFDTSLELVENVYNAKLVQGPTFIE